MSSERDPAEWLEFANADLRAAEWLTKSRPMSCEIVTFHYQSATEDMLPILAGGVDSIRREVMKVLDRSDS
jgi:hypothetical protein